VAYLGYARTRVAPPPAPRAAPARDPGREAAAALADEQRALVERASEAAAVGPLRAALGSRVDGPTLDDLLATEDWWRPFREQMTGSRVVLSDVRAGQGVDLGETDGAVVAAARSAGSAAEIVAPRGQPLMLGAARVELAGSQEHPVVILVRAFDARALQSLAERTRLDLMLTDGRTPLLMAAAGGHRAILEGLARRTSTTAVIDPPAGWAAARVPVSPALSLWAVVGTPVVTSPPPVDARPFWAGAGVLALAGLVLVSLRGPRPGVDLAPEGATPAPVAPESTVPIDTGEAIAALAEPAPPAHATPALGVAEGLEDSGPPVVVVAPPRAPERPFGRYKLTELLGVGGMSEVYSAVAHGAEGFTRTFVIKRLRPELVNNKEAVAQFIEEARTQASLVHSNIVPVFDFGTIDGEYFMTEEYIIGRDLSRVCGRCIERTGFCLDARMAYYVVHEVLQALAYAHSKKGRDGHPLGIVHRDVSATNIMMSSAGEVKLFDFGIAKTNRERTVQTQVGMVKGNANFMSPEQARGQAVDARSDLFSMGLVLYFALGSQMLYTGENDLDILYRAACGPTEQDFQLISQLQPPASEVLRKALAIDPAQRYQTAEEFAVALAPFAVGMKAEAASLMEMLFGEELRREAA
jgi:tRNA A-37 threonylcarbamoyl transferase component Bud32